MTHLKNILFCACFSFYFYPVLMAQEVKYGLEFASHEVEKENRTSLDLTPVKPFKFSKGFSISFDVLFKQESKQIFGYILRIIGNNNQNIDLVLSSEKGILYPNIVATSSKTESLVNYLFSENNNTFNQWIPIAITFEMDKKRLDISIGNKRYTFENSNLNDFKDVRIVFGKNDYLKSQIIDVPPMVIKNITISDARQKPLYYWDLSKHTSEGIYDDLKNHFAVCSNPIWIIDRHAQWEKLLSINTKSNPQICYNEKTNDVAIADKKVFITYNTNNNILKKDSLVYGQPHGNLINQLIYNLFTNKYCSYSFEKKITYYDSLKKSWNNNSPDFDQYHWHHNRYLYPGDSCLYIFFGYGHHKYKNNILKYNFKTDSMETISFHGDTIPPRYLSGLGKIDDDRIIIFGGHGSVSGNQELAPHNYYDSYIINLRSKRIKKLWELNISDKSFVVANSLVVDTIRHCFYTLCYPQQEFRTHLMLYRFSLDLPEYEILADSIPFAFHDIYSYTDLFLNKEKRELIALTSSPLIPDSTSFLSIYTLAYPPLARADLIQKETRQNNKLTLALILIISMLGLYGGYFVYNRMKKKMRKQEKEQVNEISVSVSNPENEEEIVSSGIKPVNIQLKKQSIFLFGGFQVIDKEGQDITKEFTPLLEHLFLIILLYTLKDGKGISSVKLREILWFDKNEESAKNNRGVALNKLRQIFEPVGIIHINKQYLSWIIEFGEDIYCDYYEALILMNRLKDRGNRTTKDIKRLLSIVSAGELLHHLQVEWIDSFKADFSNNLIDLFLDIAQQNELDISMQNKIDLAESILIHDSLNEDALKLKCSILVKMGKNGLAKMAYSSFSKEYRLLFGTDFKYSFEQMISQ